MQSSICSLTSAAIVAGLFEQASKGMRITAAFPVTIKTAIVSPIARPIPKIAPAVIRMPNKG
jgi:hypothetical protein